MLSIFFGLVKERTASILLGGFYPLPRFGQGHMDRIGFAGRRRFDVVATALLIRRQQARNAAATIGHSFEMEAGSAETIQLIVDGRPINVRMFRLLSPRPALSPDGWGGRVG
jgi:hypothetical protein